MRNHSLDEQETARDALKQSREDLLHALDEIDVGLPSFLGVNEEEPIKRSYMKLQFVHAKYNEIICLNEEIRSLVLDTHIDRRVTLVCAIADLLAFSGAATVAALLIKEGMHAWCKDCWSK